jgi:hypothetical protein
MSRRDRVPAYRLHKQSGQAVVTLPDGLGRRRDVLLGRYGTPESRKEYARVLAESEAAGRRTPQPTAASDVTVNELLPRYWKHARGYYAWAKEPTRGDKVSLPDALRVVRKMHGHTLAREFGPLALKACRDRMVRKGWARTYVNAQVDRVRRMFRWAAEEEMLPGGVRDLWQGVRAPDRGPGVPQQPAPRPLCRRRRVRRPGPPARPEAAALRAGRRGQRPRGRPGQQGSLRLLGVAAPRATDHGTVRGGATPVRLERQPRVAARGAFAALVEQPVIVQVRGREPGRPARLVALQPQAAGPTVNGVHHV